MLVETQLSDALADDIYVPAADFFEVWAGAALVQQCVGDAELLIRVVDANESQSLNKDYRDKDAPTNVLSFALDTPEFITPRMLGDLVICAEVVEFESREQGKSCDAHWAHMVVHGVLHLLGFDHQDDKQGQQMEALEIEIMQALGFASPYES